MNPPLRTEDDRRALVDGLRDGTIDCIATDHAPHARDEKEVPFEQAPMGTTGLETAFAAVFTDLVAPGVLRLGARRRADDVRRRDCSGCRVPRIEAGAPANLDARRPRGRVGRRRARLRVAARRTAASPGGTLRGKVLLTVAAGAVAWRERAFAVVGG